WLRLARERVHFQGLPARICWLGHGDRAKAGRIFNDLVASGRVKAPLVIGRDHLDSGSVASPHRETESMRDGSDAIADWPILNALVNTAAGATASTCRASRRERRYGPMISADLIVTNLAELVTCEPALGEGPLGVITRGAIAAAGGRIVWVGPESRLAAEVGAVPGAQRIDGRGAVGPPGLVDSHTHAISAGSREEEYALRARGASYREIAVAGRRLRPTE